MAQLKFRNNKSVLNNVQKWLISLHGDEVCPNLQPDVHDVEYLLTLKSQNEESERNVAEEIKLKKSRIHSINTKTEELKTFLKSEDVFLKEETWKQVDSIAGLAEKLNIEELDLTNLLLAIYSMKNENIEKEEQRMMNCAMMSSCSKKNLKIKKSNDILKSQIDAMREVVDIQDSNRLKLNERIKFFKVKCAEYDRKVKFYKDHLKDKQFENHLQHSSLVEWSKVIEALEEKLKILIEKLNNYRKLPPNESLTKLKIQEKKEELSQLENEFISLIEMWENRDGNKDITIKNL